MKLKTLIRIVSFVIISGSFIFAATLAITLAQGTTFNEDGSIIQTSIMQVNTIPGDVEVYLDGKKIRLQNRAIEWVQPGTRKLLLSREGYLDWEKEIEVEAGIVEDIFAQLFPSKLQIQSIVENQVDRVYFSTFSDYVYYTILNSNNQSQDGLWRLKLSRNFLDFGTNSPARISPMTQLIDKLRTNEYSLLLSDDNDKVILSIPGLEEIYLYEVSGDTQVTDLKAVLGYFPDRIFWFRGSTSIVVEKNNLLFEFELETQQKTIIDFVFDGKLNYFVNTDFVFFKSNQDNQIRIYSNKLSSPFQFKTLNISLPEEIGSIIGVRGSRDSIILVNNNGFIYINVDKRFIENISSSKVIKISNNGRVVLFERNGEIFSYALENTPNNLSLTSEIYSLGVTTEENIDISITPNNRTILYKNINLEEERIYLQASDLDGKNPRQLLLDQVITSDSKFVFNGDSTSLYVSLRSQGPLTNNPSVIYEAKLQLN